MATQPEPRELHPVTFLKGDGRKRSDADLYPASKDFTPKYTPVDAEDEAESDGGQSD